MLDTISISSDTSSIGARSQQTNASSNADRLVSYTLNCDQIVSSQLETITNRYWANSNYVRVPIKPKSVNFAFEKLKQQSSKLKNFVVFDCDNNVELTEDDKKLSPINENNDDNDDEKLSKEEEFEKFYGTSIQIPAANHKKPYLSYTKSVQEMEQQLDHLLVKNSEKTLKQKSTLTGDIEQQFCVKPFRQSRRQRKKQNLEQNSKSLKDWFDMPRVTEISKEQEKDLMALKMRRIWDPKHFYKKSSQTGMANGSDGSGGGGVDSSRFFQIGTVADSSVDFYNSRVVKRERKRTILDELMNDQQVRAYNKRKMQYAMNKNSRLRMVMKRAKLSKQKQRIRQRRMPKTKFGPDGGGFNSRSNKFTTYDI